MIEILLEAIKYIAAMLGTSAGLNIILRNKLHIPMNKDHVPYLPLTVLIEELMFRLVPFTIIGLATANPIISLSLSSSIFAFFHIGNLKDIPHSWVDTFKYTLNITILGVILGLMYLQHGFWFTYIVHLLYDFIVVALMLGRNKDGST